MRFAYQHPFSGDEFRYRGYFDLAAFCVLFRSDRISRANSNAICRFSDVKWMKFSVVLDMRTTWQISKITSLTDTVDFRPSIKKSGVSCMGALKDVL